MRWLWIFAGIVLVLFLLSILRIGVRISIRETAAAWVTIGPFRIQAAPSKPSKNKKKGGEKKEKPSDGKDRWSGLKALPKPTLEDLRSAVRTLGPPVKKALRRTGRSIRIRPLRLSVTVGGARDPAEAAKLYGLIHAAVWTVMPAAEELLAIPEPGIHVGLDFDLAKTKAEGEIGISIRLGTIAAVGFGIGVPALKWHLAWRKKRKPPARSGQKRETVTGGTAA